MKPQAWQPKSDAERNAVKELVLSFGKVASGFDWREGPCPYDLPALAEHHVPKVALRYRALTLTDCSGVTFTVLSWDGVGFTTCGGAPGVEPMRYQQSLAAILARLVDGAQIDAALRLADLKRNPTEYAS